MDRAVEAARQGDLIFFSSLPEDQLAALVTQKDEDERSLLHTACASSNPALVQYLADQPGAKGLVNAADEEVDVRPPAARRRRLCHPLLRLCL